jgi:hypothetical protein
MLTDDEVAELAALRARAYGPEADLIEDPASLARLAELERRAHPDVPVPDASAIAPAAPASEVPALSDAPAAAAPGDTPLRADLRAPSDESASQQASLDDVSDSPVQTNSPRRTWSRRAVMLVGIPVVAVACAVGAAVGAAVAAQTAGITPSPSTTLAARYVSSLRSISEIQTWDAGSPRLLADLNGALMWDGTTAGGLVTCLVVVEDASQQPLTDCEATDVLKTSGVGVSVADERTGTTHTYMAWPKGAPVVMYTMDDPNPSP